MSREMQAGDQMAQLEAEDRRATITPSDVVLLRASELTTAAASSDSTRGTWRTFPGQWRLDLDGSGLQLFEGQEAHPSEAWALAMPTTALLALEQDGRYRLEVHEESTWAGLSSRNTVIAIAAGRPLRQKPLAVAKHRRADLYQLQGTGLGYRGGLPPREQHGSGH